jgi:peptide deformylase
MKKVIDCNKEKNPLINKKLKEVTVEEGLKIAKILLETLNERQDGVGLAANQVGIDAAVAVVNVREPIILINPKIIQAWGEIPYYEGCLSFKGKAVNTKRYENVIVTSAQQEGKMYFSGAENPSDGKGSWEETKKRNEDRDIRLLESVCVQHEIDHLNGMTIMDRQMITTITNEKIGRNQKVTISNGSETKELKWKKAETLVNNGEWEIIK